ncbi:hypothetical protein [Terricaulis sp.]|uniref:hypothetical protein n=1 Tax=Terricaulis sp. TaxID=2768686 RepID=UPI0037834629
MAEPLKGTFFALRRRARGGVILSAAVVHGVLALALTVLLGVLYGRAIAPMAGSLGEDESAATQAVLSSPMLFLAAAFLYALITASFEAALLRWMIRGETTGFAGFSLGGDTWLVYAGYWIWFAVATGVWILTFLLSVLGLSAFNVTGYGATVEGGSWIGFAALGLWALLLTPIALRMCTGNAASIARRRFAYFESWRVSRRRSLALLGSFGIHWAMWAVVAVAIMLGLAMLGYLMLGAGESELAADESNLVFSTSSLIALFVANLMIAVLAAGTNARAVLAAIEEGKLEGMTPDLATVFD